MLLRAVLSFVEAAQLLPGVLRIAMVGSLTTTKPIPKDADVLVTIEPGLALGELARLGRQLKWRAQQINLGADIFLCEPVDRYIGRTCSYRECHPRVACSGHCCGTSSHLKDDLDVVTLKPELVRAPPLELWPNVVRRYRPPEDVERLLLAPLEGKGDKSGPEVES